MPAPFTRRFLALAAAALAACAGQAHAADPYPDRPISIVVPLPPGSFADSVARALGDELSGVLKQPVIVENKPSASQIVASNYLARSQPNGYTLMIGVMPNVIAPRMLSGQAFRGNTDFKAVSHVLYIASVLAVSPKVSANNAPEFMELLKKNPGKYMYGSSGIGTPSHLFQASLNSIAGTESVHVPYKAFQTIMTDIMTDTVQYGMMPYSVMQFVQQGKMKVLGVGAPRRDPAYPDIPTFDEQGIKGIDTTMHYMLVTNKDTPPEIVNRLNTAVNTVLARESFAAKFKAFGGVTVTPPHTPARAAEVMKREDERFAPLIREGKVVLE